MRGLKSYEISVISEWLPTPVRSRTFVSAIWTWLILWLIKGFYYHGHGFGENWKKESNQLFQQDSGNNPTFWEINNHWRLGLGFPVQTIERDSPSVWHRMRKPKVTDNVMRLFGRLHVLNYPLWIPSSRVTSPEHPVFEFIVESFTFVALVDKIFLLKDWILICYRASWTRWIMA
jgi:hypothetical protein